MDITLLIAKIFGVYALVGGLSGLLYPARMQKALSEATRSYLLPYFDGALALIIGLLIVISHNVWGTFTEIIISLIGWIAIIEGAALFLLPHNTIVGFAKIFSSREVTMGWSVLAIVLGAFLTYVGFIA
ncbi:MAG: hypothetical protein ACJKTH_01680 [Patescibacteria group bacterium UBA2163]